MSQIDSIQKVTINNKVGVFVSIKLFSRMDTAFHAVDECNALRKNLQRSFDLQHYDLISVKGMLNESNIQKVILKLESLEKDTIITKKQIKIASSEKKQRLTKLGLWGVSLIAVAEAVKILLVPVQ